MVDLDEPVTVWWIDDDHANVGGPRDGERKALARKAGPRLKLMPMHPVDFVEDATSLAAEEAPDLLLIDFRLGAQQLPGRDTPFFVRDGVRLRAVALGIEELKDAPAYLVSSVTGSKQIGSLDDRFDWVMSHRQLTSKSGGKLLLEDARDYRRLQEALRGRAGVGDPESPVEGDLVKGVVGLLGVPAASADSVEELVHRTVGNVLRKESVLDSEQMKLAPSRPRSVARWIRSALHRVRGPLIDELMAATMLGMSVDYFCEKVGSQIGLDSLRSEGIFWTTARTTLWRQAFLERVLSVSEKIELSPATALAETAAVYFKVPEHNRAACRVCGEPWPETVGFDEEDRTVEAPVHWRCSTEAEGEDSLFGFNVVRSFRS